MQIQYKGTAKVISRGREAVRDVIGCFPILASQCRHGTNTHEEGGEHPCSFLATGNNINSDFVSMG